MKVKICGLTRVEDAHYVNEAKADYAGFVFFSKSKRNLSFEQAKEIMDALDADVKKVAVTVSPDKELVSKLCQMGFDIIQIHKELTKEVLEATSLPIWYAFNVADDSELDEKERFFEELGQEYARKVTGIVVDSSNFGSGQTFDWQKSKRLKKAGAQSPPIFDNRDFILAGGLNPYNVKEGIEIFNPDVCDVSSGVEGQVGKDKNLVMAFTKNARG